MVLHFRYLSLSKVISFSKVVSLALSSIISICVESRSSCKTVCDWSKQKLFSVACSNSERAKSAHAALLALTVGLFVSGVHSLLETSRLKIQLLTSIHGEHLLFPLIGQCCGNDRIVFHFCHCLNDCVMTLIGYDQLICITCAACASLRSCHHQA